MLSSNLCFGLVINNIIPKIVKVKYFRSSAREEVSVRDVQQLKCCVLALGTSWTTYQCQVLKLKFIMYGGNLILILIQSHLYNWHFPTMVGYCHGGNMSASHDNGISDDNNVYLTWSFHEGSCAIRAAPFLDVRFIHFQVKLHHGRRSIPAKSGSV